MKKKINRKIIYKTRDLNINDDSKMSIEVELSNNRLNSKYLQLSKKVSFDEVYFKILILTLCIGLFIFTSIYLVIKASIEPFKKANQ